MTEKKAPRRRNPKAVHGGARARVAFNIGRLLKETGQTPQALCNHFNSQSLYYDGKEAFRGYTLDTLGRIADFFGCDLSQLFVPEKEASGVLK